MSPDLTEALEAAPPRRRARLPALPVLPWRRPRHTLFVQADGVWAWPPDAAHDRPVRHAGLDAWIAAHPGTQANIALSGELLHQIVLDDAALPLEDAAAVAAYARHQFVHYHGAGAHHWPVVGWHVGGQRGASALHGLDFAACQAAARRARVALQVVAPLWACALRAASRDAAGFGRQPQATLVVVEGTLVQRLHCRAGRLVDIEPSFLPAPSADALLEALAQWREAQGAPAPLVLGFGLDRMPEVDARQAQVLGRLDLPHIERRWVTA